MTFSKRIGGAWKEASAMKCKVGGEWKDLATLYAKKDGVWMVVFSGGALIEFTSYAYPIPVMAGWQYRTDTAGDWIDITEDGVLNESGTFTGQVKAKSELVLDGYYRLESVREDGEVLSLARSHQASFVNNSKGYVCGGNSTASGGHVDTVDVYDSSGTRTTGTSLSESAVSPVSFVNNSKGYVCGGSCTSGYSAVVNVYDSSGTRTIGTSLSVERSYLTAFVNEGKGYVCGGTGKDSDGYSAYYDTVDVYDSSGTRTTGTSLSEGRSKLTAFVNEGKGYVCGGYKSGYSAVVDVYDSSGTRTTGTSLILKRNSPTSFVNERKGYVCGGYNYGAKTYVDVYDSSGTRTYTTLSSGAYDAPTFVINSKGYVCGGTFTDVFDSSGTRSTGIPTSVSRGSATAFVNNSKGYVCGGWDGSTQVDSIDVFYDAEVADIPMTAGSTYTIDGTSTTVEESGTVTLEGKFTGTVKYKSGSI